MSEEVLPEQVVCKECFRAFRPEEMRRTAGRCAGCGQQVCLRCGCTDTRGCVREAAGGIYTCTWGHPVARLGAYCSFCVFVITEHLYAEAVAGEEAHAG